MPVGLEILNSTGNVQITPGYKNLSLVSKGRITKANDLTVGGDGSQYTWGNRLYYARVFVPGDYPIVAISPDTSGRCCASVWQIYPATGGWTVQFSYTLQPGYASPLYPSNVKSLGTNDGFDYYIFNTYTAPTNNFGLDVFDSAGGLVFSSGLKYMRVLRMTNYTRTSPSGDMASFFISQPNSFVSGTTYGIPVPVGKKYAIVQCNPCVYWEWDTPNWPEDESIVIYWYRSFVAMHNGYIGYADNVPNGEQGPFNNIITNYFGPQGAFLLLDVTNY